MSISDKADWNRLVENKRKYSSQLHDLTKKLIDLDCQITDLNNRIRNQRTTSGDYLNELNTNRKMIEKANHELLSISHEVSKSKDFISMLEKSTKTSPETELEKTITLLKERLDKNKANSKPEKNNNLEEYKNLIMQLDALNALRAVRNQLSELNGKSLNLIKDNTRLENERVQMKQRLTHNRILINNYHDERKNMIEKKTLLMHDYDELLVVLESVNRKLDALSTSKEYSSYGRNKDQKIMEIKNNAAKKIKEGGRISLDELRLLYDK